MCGNAPKKHLKQFRTNFKAKHGKGVPTTPPPLVYIEQLVYTELFNDTLF